MKAIRIIINIIIWFAILWPIATQMAKNEGIDLAISIYSYILLMIFAIITIDKFDNWFKSKLK